MPNLASVMRRLSELTPSQRWRVKQEAVGRQRAAELGERGQAMTRQRRKRAAFVDAFESVSETWGGEARSARRRMAWGRARRVA